MKRDLDLVRKILLDIEEKETIEGYRGTPEIEGYLSEEISCQVRMMGEANY